VLDIVSKFGPLSENCSLPLVSQAGYGPGSAWSNLLLISVNSEAKHGQTNQRQQQEWPESCSASQKCFAFVHICLKRFCFYQCRWIVYST